MKQEVIAAKEAFSLLEASPSLAASAFLLGAQPSLAASELLLGAPIVDVMKANKSNERLEVRGNEEG
jgi:hypothetical protein